MDDHKTLAKIKKKLHYEMPIISRRYKVKSLGVFGSYVRQENKTSSDIDILVAFSEPPSLLKFIELENYLTDVLEIKVDLVMQEALKPRIGEKILREVIPV
jgi:uncharacterized protein